MYCKGDVKQRATASPSSRFTSLDIGAEALSTAEYYELIAGLAGVPVPKMVVREREREKKTKKRN